MKGSLLFAAAALFAALSPVKAAAATASTNRIVLTNAPPRAQLQAQAARCRHILRTNLLGFYLPACVDTIYGGYLESLVNGQFGHTGEKFLTLQARQLWFFSMVAAERYDQTQAALNAARSGYTFIATKMRDARNGGFYSKVTDEGAPRDARKHAYLHAFAMYGFTAYYRATRDPAALQAAQHVYQMLETRARDRLNGGYYEFFYPDWRLITNQAEPTYVGAVGTKTYNTHLHLLEAYADLYRVWPDPALKQRLEELIAIVTITVKGPGALNNVDAFLPNWEVVNTAANLRASYGHDVECAWLTLDAVSSAGLPPRLYIGWADTLCRASINPGYDKNFGGLFAGGPLNQSADDTRKIWWVQAEALVAFLEMYRLTQNREYYNLFSQTLDFVEKFQVAPEGSWWATRAADGSAVNDAQRTGPWQGAYHAGRAMMLCARLLDQMAAAAR